MLDPFMTHMTVNSDRTRLIWLDDQGGLTWCTLDEAGIAQVKERLELSTLPDIHEGDRAIRVQFVRPDEVLVIIEGTSENKWCTFILQDRLLLVTVLPLTLPYQVLRAARVEEHILMLFAVRQKKGGLRLGIYIPEQLQAIWVTPLLDHPHPQLAFWNANQQEIGVNVGQKGRIYTYSLDREMPGAVHLKQTYPHAIMDKWGNCVALSVTKAEGYVPAQMNSESETGAIREFEQEYLFSELSRVQYDRYDPSVLICEGIYQGRVQYVVYDTHTGKCQKLREVAGTLSQSVLSRNKRGIIGKYESIACDPVPGQYDFSKHTVTRMKGDVHPSLKVAMDEVRVEYHEMPMGDEHVPYVDIYPKRAHSALIYLHGGPHNCFMDHYSPVIKRLQHAGVRIIGLNYPGSSGFHPAYRQSLYQDWGGKDVDSIRHMRETILQSYRHVSLYGASYGAYLALLTGGIYPELWENVIACAPFTDLGRLYADGGTKMKEFLQMELGSLLQNESVLRGRSPVAYARELSLLNIQLIHGERDAICPLDQSVLLHQLIERERAKQKGTHKRLEFHTIPDLQHEVYSERFWGEKVLSFLLDDLKVPANEFRVSGHE